MFSKRFPHLPFWTFLSFVIPAVPVFALNPLSEQDTYGLSMGNAAAALAGGTHAIQWNPAGVARATVPMSQLGLGFNPGTTDILFNTSVLYPFADGTVFALSQFSDLPSSPTSSTAYIGSIALPLDSSRDFLMGINLKYLAQSILVGSAPQGGRGLGLDFGLSYDLRRPQGPLASFALAVKDAATEVRFADTDEQSVTRTFTFGAAYLNIPDTRIEMDLELVDQISQSSALHNRLRLGAERFFGNRFYSVRAGFDDLFNSDGYFSLGAGYHPDQPFEISYALRGSVNNGQFTHLISFIYRFDKLGKNEPVPEKPAAGSSAEINIGSVQELTEETQPTGKPISAAILRKMAIEVDPPVFSPAGKEKTVSISFPEGATAGVARWLIEFQTSQQRTVRRIGGTGPVMPQVSWDGLNEEGRAVPDGKYRVALKTFNQKNEMISDDFQTVEVLSARTHFGIQAANKYFSFNAGKRKRGEAVFNVIAGGPAEVQNWDFEISEASSNKVVFQSHGENKLPKTLKWNGKNLNNEAVADGNYLCLLIAQDQAGNPLKTDALKITVNSTPPELTLRGEDNLFDFNTKKDFHFTLGAADRVGFQDWKLDVRGEDGKSVTIFDGAGSPPREVVWNGNGIEPGSILSAVFSATDNAGNQAATKPFNVQIDYQPVESGEQMTLNLTTVYFPVVSTDLGEDGRKEIKKAAASIQPYLNKSVLVVKGYASPLEAGDPLILSRNRAQEVKKFLVKTLNLSPDSVFAVGYGTRASSKGAADNASGESQRRAVITLTTKP